MAANAQSLGRMESLRYFVRARRAVGWLAVVSVVATFIALARGFATATVPFLFALVLYGIWLYLSLLERREALLLENVTGQFASRELAAERAQLGTAIGILVAVLTASVLIVGFLLGSQWLGALSLLLFLYLLVVGGPYWLAEVLARGEDARQRPR